VKTADFDYVLPPELIAQQPPAARGQSRLLVLDRQSGAISHHQFAELPSLLHSGDALVVNDTRVFPARLIGRRLPGGGAAECFLVQPVTAADDSVSSASSVAHDTWSALVHPGQRLREGSRMVFESDTHRLHAEILGRHFHGRRTVRLWTDDGGSVGDAIEALGHVPLPPYIKREDVAADRERYQTVYASVRGSIAAPTAGLHFTSDLLDSLATRGIERLTITLHVGYGTFQPVRVDQVENHQMEAEHYDVPSETATRLSRALGEGRRVIAVGTTSTRTLESLSISHDGAVQTGHGETTLFIRPGHRFQLVSGLITNFHLPRSSLLMLVCAFGGTEAVLEAYRQAVANRYRFYSYGDAMLIL
jgi:S-adenosylmethionine:tRNA ribosyltransferase-isomerase